MNLPTAKECENFRLENVFFFAPVFFNTRDFFFVRVQCLDCASMCEFFLCISALMQSNDCETVMKTAQME